MKKTLITYSLVISLIAALATPFILDNLVGSQLTAKLPMIVGICFALFWVATLIVGVKFVPPGEAEDAPWSNSEADRETGTVKWFNITKGFGFITRDQGGDAFIHFRSIRGSGHRTLLEGQRVRFSVTVSDKGMQAEDVTIVD